MTPIQNCLMIYTMTKEIFMVHATASTVTKCVPRCLKGSRR